ncbi:MAG: hypothetical protein JW940_29520 [Polyangiaceae bacterium]|nr:hypothetical protein [Polyangiaceae bacterium]
MVRFTPSGTNLSSCSPNLARCRALLLSGAAAAVTATPAPGWAQSARAGSLATETALHRTDEGDDRYSVHADSTTVVPVLRRALLPGPGGALVKTDTYAAAHEYLQLSIRDLDAPWAKDSVDAELSLWSALQFAGADRARPLEGDISVADASARLGPGRLRLGRQFVTEGAARYAHLDGLYAAVRSGFGLGGSAYAGLTVLPRWSDRPGYYQLGSAFDTLVSTPDALPDPERSGYWMAGGRVYYSQADVAEIGLSYHEQREGRGLGRRDAALDAELGAMRDVDLSLRGLLDLDSVRLADAFAGLAVYPTSRVDVSAEYRRVVPTLLVSRQSVFSVFMTDRFDECGGELRYRPSRRITLGGSSYLELFGGTDPGFRGSLWGSVAADERRTLTLTTEYTRVLAGQNGYHALRLSARSRPIVPLTVVGEQYLYLYDEAIHGATTSSVEALSAEYSATGHLRVMLGGSVYHTPYAARDIQALARLTYELDTVGRDPW